MKPHVVVALLVWASFPPGPGRELPAARDVIRDPCPEEQAAVADTLRELFRAAERRDLDRVEALHLYGPKFSKFDEFGLGRESADQVRVAERQGLTSLRSFRARIEDLKVDVIGVAAVATFGLHYSAETGQGEAAARLRASVVFAKDSSSWRIVHEHYSPFATQQ
jgi:ketosteroid isomerase-like protein